MLATIGFCELVFMFAAYVVLDGYDFGVGTIAPFVTTSAEERGALLAAIGPFWNGNEVWLIAAGGVLFAFFPDAYAVSFSGFYLPFIIVLWLFMLRGVAIELREQIDSEVWRTLWDAVFTIASALLAVMFGVALGNLIRGVGLKGSGFFFGTFYALLNPFAAGTGVFALLALAMHGAVFAAMSLQGALAERCAAFARRLWWLVLLLFVGMTVAAFGIDRGMVGQPLLSAALTLASLVALIAVFRSTGRAAFQASSTFLALLICTAAATLFPYLIPSYPRGHGGLTIYAATAGTSTPALATMIALVAVALGALLIYRALIAAHLGRSTVTVPPVH